jgi:hypothetical protein
MSLADDLYYPRSVNSSQEICAFAVMALMVAIAFFAAHVLEYLWVYIINPHIQRAFRTIRDVYDIGTCMRAALILGFGAPIMIAFAFLAPTLLWVGAISGNVYHELGQGLIYVGAAFIALSGLAVLASRLRDEF